MARISITFFLLAIVAVVIISTCSKTVVNASPVSPVKLSTSSSEVDDSPKTQLGMVAGMEDDLQSDRIVSEEQGIVQAGQDNSIKQASASSSRLAHLRVKRNRPKFRYNRNKDVERDY